MDTFGKDLASIKKIFPFVDENEMLLTLLELQKDVARMEVDELTKGDAKLVVELSNQVEAAFWDDRLWGSTLNAIKKADLYHYFKHRETIEVNTSRLDFS